MTVKRLNAAKYSDEEGECTRDFFRAVKIFNMRAV